MNDEGKIAVHDVMVKTVAVSVARLGTDKSPIRFPLEAVFEGAVKGGAVALLQDPNVSAKDIADMLEAFACEFRNLGVPNLHVVK